MTDQRSELLALADYLDDIVVDADGLCLWTDVANAQTHIRAGLRRLAPPIDREAERKRIVRIIAENIQCETDCATGPSGCGCSQKAADAILSGASVSKEVAR